MRKADSHARRPGRRLDFFISYTQIDKPWAVWIAETLEEAGYTVSFQARDIPAGRNWSLAVHEHIKTAEHTLAVLSPAYLESDFCAAEWSAALVQDATGKAARLLPVRVAACERSGLLAAISYVDLVDKAEADAKRTLLAQVRLARVARQGIRLPRALAHAGRRRTEAERAPFPGPSEPEMARASSPAAAGRRPSGPALDGARDSEHFSKRHVSASRLAVAGMAGALLLSMFAWFSGREPASALQTASSASVPVASAAASSAPALASVPVASLPMGSDTLAAVGGSGSGDAALGSRPTPSNASHVSAASVRASSERAVVAVSRTPQQRPEKPARAPVGAAAKPTAAATPRAAPPAPLLPEEAAESPVNDREPSGTSPGSAPALQELRSLHGRL